MAVNVNLSRSTKVYYTTLTATDNGYSDSNTFEIQVMNGYSFSQGTEQQTIQINEAGATPNRGQRSFNTQLNPVEWNFGTYVRPNKPSTNVTCVERALWNAFACATADPAASAAWVEGTGYATLSLTNSNVHTLAAFALIFKVDNTYYKVNNCAVNTAEVNFGIDQIAMINWSGFGTTFAEITDTDALTELPSITAADSNAHFITNKLSTVVLNSNISGDGSTGGSISYSLPITGGTLTLSNNLTYLTPEILGIVNNSIGYFTGTRAVGGNLTAYLRTGTGSNHTGKLLQDILTGAATSTETKFNMTLQMGGGTNASRVDFLMPATMLQVPTIDIQDVVSTTINFTAQGYTSTNYDITSANEIQVRYYSAAT